MRTVVEFLKENLLINLPLSNGDIDFNNHVFELAEKMEEKEKALELFEKFGVYDFHPENTGNGWVKNIEESKKMAIKVADELIKQEQHHRHHLWVKYYEEVKSEIEKIGRENYSLHYAY